MSGLEHEFSVIALWETWLAKDVESLYDLSNYNAIHYHIELRVGGGGSLFLHKDIQFIHRDDLMIQSESVIVESIFVIPSVPILVENVIIGCVYRPPDTDIDNFSGALSITLDLINKEGKLCYLLGDYNINLFMNEQHTQTGYFFEYHAFQSSVFFDL